VLLRISIKVLALEPFGHGKGREAIHGVSSKLSKVTYEIFEQDAGYLWLDFRKHYLTRFASAGEMPINFL
jgi:hypothetical protein